MAFRKTSNPWAEMCKLGYYDETAISQCDSYTILQF